MEWPSHPICDLFPNVMEPQLTALLEKDKRIDLVYLFGSMAKGNPEQSKDADIGLYLEKPITGLDKLSFITEMGSKLKPFFKKPVDIVILNNASSLLCHQVLKYGRLLFERKKGTATLFAVQTMTRYFDYLQILNFFTSRKLGQRK